MMTELQQKLEKIPDAYYDFVMGMLSYAKESGLHRSRLEKYIEQNPDADTSAVIEHISSFPDFFSSPRKIPEEAFSVAVS